ncbi:MAG: site-specific integrase [Ruminococcaceae bacterium]|nr:site-specific integrase [Oscillospiraceae bacterium]
MARNKKGSDGRYRYRIYLGKDERGTKKFKSFYGSTEKEAKAAAEEYRSAIRKGLDPDQAKDATLATLYDNLITAKKAKGIGQKSLDRYANNRDAWGALKDMPAGELKAADFQRVLNDLADWHDGKPPLSHFTLTNLRSSAKAAYDLAIPEIVLYNPIIKVTCPAGAPAEPREPISEEQQQWIRETPHKAQRAAMLLLYSGFRRGEATALTWADVDLDAATITVTKGYNFTGKSTKKPKTEAGSRVVSIPKILVDYLRTQRDDCLYVLHNDKGQRMTEQGWKRLWESYMRDLNVKYGYGGKQNKNRPGGLPMVIDTFTPHQLRHTFCTLMYFAGVDVLTARDQMGHKDITVTLGIYTSLDKKFKKKKINRLDAYLKKSTAIKLSSAGSPVAQIG